MAIFLRHLEDDVRQLLPLDDPRRYGSPAYFFF
jgi:hypothetical protein